MTPTVDMKTFDTPPGVHSIVDNPYNKSIRGKVWHWDTLCLSRNASYTNHIRIDDSSLFSKDTFTYNEKSGDDEIFDIDIQPIYTQSFKIKVKGLLINKNLPPIIISDEELI